MVPAESGRGCAGRVQGPEFVTPSSIVVLLGRKDFPTDGVEDYCENLSRALESRSYRPMWLRLPWAELGWSQALTRLWRQSRAWKGRWVLIQYTALSWSRHGLPLLFLFALCVLKYRRARLAVIFHDSIAWPGNRLRGRVQRACQHLVMRLSHYAADKSILPVPPDGLCWLPPDRSKAVFIPVGANVPSVRMSASNRSQPSGLKTIGVFGITDGGSKMSAEVSDIVFVTREVSQHVAQLRLLTLGRGSQGAAESLRQALNGTSVQFVALGLLPAEQVSQRLTQADVVLFLRGGISSRRASAIAAIACGVPLVAYSGLETGSPVSEAGVVLVPLGEREELARAVIRVLTDEHLWWELHRRSVFAQQQYFSWDAIADRFETVLSHE
jgi:glycosyltransferase involved in cell wall biosynthesis